MVSSWPQPGVDPPTNGPGSVRHPAPVGWSGAVVRIPQPREVRSRSRTYARKATNLQGRPDAARTKDQMMACSYGVLRGALGRFSGWLVAATGEAARGPSEATGAAAL